MVLVEFFDNVIWRSIAQFLAQFFETLEDLFKVLGPEWDIGGSVRLRIWRSGICAVRVKATAIAYSIIVDIPVFFFSFWYGSRRDDNSWYSSGFRSKQQLVWELIHCRMEIGRINTPDSSQIAQSPDIIAIV